MRDIGPLAPPFWFDTAVNVLNPTISLDWILILWALSPHRMINIPVILFFLRPV
jgi:hypothetical protein